MLSSSMTRMPDMLRYNDLIQTYKSKRNRWGVLLIFLLALLSFFVTSDRVYGGDKGSTLVIAASDFQAPFPKGKDPDAISERGDVAAETVTEILEQIKEDYPEADGFLFAGDYDVVNPTTEESLFVMLEKLKTAVESQYSFSSEIFIQGNHEEAIDPTGETGNGLALSGANDTDSYGVFVINEKDYAWRESGSETVTAETADNLKAYLDDKINTGWKKPIFLVSHLPLHITLRNQEGDGLWARYLFDVIQDAGAAGLQLIFLYGHNHDNGWDNYLGGASVYLRPGDCIRIARPGSMTEFDCFRLNFTYLNAGYVGYYTEYQAKKEYFDEASQHFIRATGVDDALTMTVFEITDEGVKIARYDKEGLHNLKSPGTWNSFKDPDRTQETWGRDSRIFTGMQEPWKHS